ncbi:hypothetical protein BH10BAC5_BH10BAC5_10300 [soil metagenome]
MRVYFRSILASTVLFVLLTNNLFSQSKKDNSFTKSWLKNNNTNISAGGRFDLGPSVKCDLKILQRPGLIMDSENIYLLKDVILNKMYGDTLQIQEEAKYEYYNIKEVGEVSFKTGNYSLWGTIGGTLIGAGVGMAISSVISDSKTAPAYISLGGATLVGGITGFFIGKQIPKYKIYNFSELDPDTKRDEMLRVIKENQR